MAGNVALKSVSAFPFSNTYIVANCNASLVLGDLVYFSDLATTTVTKVTSNKHDQPTVGIVIRKIESTRAKIQTYGLCDITISGLSKNQVVFTGSSGDLVTSVPSDGYIEYFGHCYHDEYLFVKIRTDRIKRNPF